MKIKERIGTAQSSSNLSESQITEIADIDVIRACGMVGVTMPLGLSLWRLKVSGDSREFHHVIDGLVDLLLRKGISEDESIKHVKKVLKHYLDDLCKICSGRGYETIPNTPVLSDTLCIGCSGTGRLLLRDPDMTENWLLEQIARMEREVSAAIMRKLSQEIDL